MNRMTGRARRIKLGTRAATRFIAFDDRPKLALALGAGIALCALTAVVTRKSKS
jgi:hypothetical protein